MHTTQEHCGFTVLEESHYYLHTHLHMHSHMYIGTHMGTHSQKHCGLIVFHSNDILGDCGAAQRLQQNKAQDQGITTQGKGSLTVKWQREREKLANRRRGKWALSRSAVWEKEKKREKCIFYILNVCWFRYRIVYLAISRHSKVHGCLLSHVPRGDTSQTSGIHGCIIR